MQYIFKSIATTPLLKWLKIYNVKKFFIMMWFLNDLLN